MLFRCIMLMSRQVSRGSVAEYQADERAEVAKTAEQLYQRNSCTVKKILGPTPDFPTKGSGKWTVRFVTFSVDAHMLEQTKHRVDKMSKHPLEPFHFRVI